VLFEGSDAAEDFAVQLEEWAAPLYAFHDAWCVRMDGLAHGFEDGFGKGWGFVDVDIDARVECVCGVLWLRGHDETEYSEAVDAGSKENGTARAMPFLFCGNA
jgi:hypothetical protein